MGEFKTTNCERILIFLGFIRGQNFVINVLSPSVLETSYIFGFFKILDLVFRQVYPLFFNNIIKMNCDGMGVQVPKLRIKFCQISCHFRDNFFNLFDLIYYDGGPLGTSVIDNICIVFAVWYFLLNIIKICVGYEFVFISLEYKMAQNTFSKNNFFKYENYSKQRLVN